MADSFSSQLNIALTSASKMKSKQTDEKIKKLSKVFGSFEATHERSPDLEKLYQALLKIAPTSMSSERAFGIAGNFLTRRRGRLKDCTVDNLCFLQSFFANERMKKHPYFVYLV